MRKNFTFFARVACFALFLSFSVNTTINAQCVSPKLVFVNPVLNTGANTAGQEGAEYKFSNVIPGVYALIKIKKLNNGAYLVAMDTLSTGYNDAWQPVVGGPTTPIGNKASIEWEIRFYTNSGSNYSFPCLDLTAIDIDGDDVRMREFVESKDYVSFSTPAVSVLNLIDDLLEAGSPGKEGKGPVANRPNIDTLSYDVRLGFHYTNKNKIRITTGVYVDNVTNPGTPSPERFSSLYFKDITAPVFSPLPVIYSSFNAVSSNQSVMINWSTSFELNNSIFQLERSFDKTNFSTIGLVLDAYNINGTDKKYQFRDNSAELAGKTVVYYRLRQVDQDGKANYSSVLAVRFQSKPGTKMQVSPNPFTEKLQVTVNANETATGEIRLMDMTGKLVFRKSLTVSKGFNTLSADGLKSIGNGMYIAQLIIGGAVIDNQKIVKGN